jgi:hypothetical protein
MVALIEIWKAMMSPAFNPSMVPSTDSPIGDGVTNVRGCGLPAIPRRGSVRQAGRMSRPAAETTAMRTIHRPLPVKITGDGAINVRGCGLAAIPRRGSVRQAGRTSRPAAETIPWPITHRPLRDKVTGDGATSVKGCGLRAILRLGSAPQEGDTSIQVAETIPCCRCDPTTGSFRSKLQHSKGAPLECASLLAPCVAAACCRSCEINGLQRWADRDDPRGKGEASFAKPRREQATALQGKRDNRKWDIATCGPE